MFEISSDSDDDCYDKFPQRLQKLKTKQALNNLLKEVDNAKDDSDAYSVSVNGENSEVILVLDSNIDNGLRNVTPTVIDTPPDGPCTRSQLRKRKNSVLLSPDALAQIGGKRSRGESSESSVAPAQPRGRGRGRGRKRGGVNQNISSSTSTSTSVTAPSPRGRRGRRGGGRRGRGRRLHNQENVQNPREIVTYSVGNTDEYPDASDDQVLFSNTNIAPDKSSDILDIDEYLNNKEISVKVFWQHAEVFKFNIRRLQKLTQIFDFFVNKAGVTKDRLLFTYNYKRTNKILRPEDTPDSIDYNIAKFIEGGIINKQFSLNSNVTPQKKGFVIKFQCQNRKKPVELTVDKDKNLQIAMLKCAEHLEIPIAELLFEFDGETIRGHTTPGDLDMDTGDCIDVKIIKLNK